MEAKIFTHIRSEFDCLLYVNGLFAGRLPPSGELPRASDFAHIEAEPGERLAVAAMPLVSEKEFGWKRLPVSCELKAGKNALSVIGGGCAQILKLPRNHFEILIREEILYGYCPPAPAAQDETYYRNERHVVTVFKDALNQAVFEGGGRLYCHVLPSGCAHEKTAFEETPQGLLIRITGSVKNMRYLAAVAFDGEYRPALNLLADRIETEGAEIQTLTRRRDVAGRAAVETYELSGGRYARKSKYAVYLHGRARKPLHPRLIPYALFEAVKAGDFAEARSFLTADLAEAVKDDGALSDFFAEYETAREPLYYGHAKNAVLLTGNGKGDLLELSYAGGKIDDMRII